MAGSAAGMPPAGDGAATSRGSRAAGARSLARACPPYATNCKEMSRRFDSRAGRQRFCDFAPPGSLGKPPKKGHHWNQFAKCGCSLASI